ncbi:hypothetical protein Tco_1447178 [Tanacetum coccineum]
MLWRNVLLDSEENSGKATEFEKKKRMSTYEQVEEMTRRLNMYGDVQLSLLWRLASNLKTRFNNKEGKIETGSTRNCVVNVAVVAAVYAFGISIRATIHVMHRRRCKDTNQAARKRPELS